MDLYKLMLETIAEPLLAPGVNPAAVKGVAVEALRLAAAKAREERQEEVEVYVALEAAADSLEALLAWVAMTLDVGYSQLKAGITTAVEEGELEERQAALDREALELQRRNVVGQFWPHLVEEGGSDG